MFRFTIEATTVINRRPEQVWAVLMDFAKYSQWSTMLLPQQSQPPRLGDTIQLRLAPPNGTPYNFAPTVIRLDEARHFAWLQKTGLPNIFDGEHHFELKPLQNGQTQLHNYEHYSGLLAPIFQRLPMMKAAPEGFEAINAEIKQQAEKS